MSAIAQLRPNNSGSSDPALLMAAFQVVPESLAIVASASRVIVYANPAWCGMFECSDPAQLQGRPVEDLIPSHLLAVRPGTAMNEEISAEAHFVHTRSDGTHLHIEVARAGFHLRGGEFQVIHTRDVSRQNEVERQLREAQTLEAVGRLVGGVVHDFNNLLTGIMLYCDLLIGELEEGSRPRRHVEEVRMAGEHGAALVQQLLAVAHPRSEKPRADEPRTFALNDIVGGIEDLVTRLVGENVVLTTSLATELGAVRMDPSQVQQILLNLVLNARDAMPDGGQITITTRNCADSLLESWVELSVTDTGDGMDAETLERTWTGHGSPFGPAARWNHCGG
jgi:signal transduction histidine kinase